jgi:hypothetical protein
MILRKDDILGNRIRCVFQTPPFTHINPGQISITTIALYVELEDGTLFDFSYPDILPPRIHAVDRTNLTLLPADFGLRPPRPCVGEEVLEIALCNSWPEMGVLLSSGRFITLDIGGDVFYASLKYTLADVQDAPAEFRSYLDDVPFDELPMLDLQGLLAKIHT